MKDASNYDEFSKTINANFANGANFANFEGLIRAIRLIRVIRVKDFREDFRL